MKLTGILHLINCIDTFLLFFFQNQFFISGLAGDDSIRNRVLEALYRRIMRAYREKKTFRVIIVIPLLPGFQVLVLENSPLLSFAGLLFEYIYFLLHSESSV